MHTCYLVVLLLVLWFQSVRCNQNAILDKNYSDRLIKPSNQQSSLQHIDGAAHHATEPLQTPHHTSNVNRPKRASVCFSFALFFIEVKIQFYVNVV